ncbi:MAG: hypothetical protein ISR58_01195 [Anaerolineales bacterium]|nr:hypothetical protein [Chloroflexota bacterium]MBL6979780.1 hypothetical protein [Anaerolineales bacterium]
MNKNIFLPIIALLLAMLACGDADTPSVPPTPTVSVFDSADTAYGFFPSPPEFSIDSLIATLDGISEHGDVILVQRAIPWVDFIDGTNANAPDIKELRDLMTLAGQRNLEPIFVIDPLNGLDRRQFSALPLKLEGGDFSTSGVRAAFKNYAITLMQEFHPRYIGLASEINTYADAHPDDFSNFVSLYQETYAAIKDASPETQVFVTFQWDDLNNAIPFDNIDGEPFHPKWEQIEIFEPQLDVWAISSYPFVVFERAADIPADYYTPLLSRTDKPIAVAEGGVNSRPIGQFPGTPQDQIDHLNAINDQLGDKLEFWIQLVLFDINAEFYRDFLRENGMETTADTILWFGAIGLLESDGTPKPALETWDNIRNK